MKLPAPANELARRGITVRAAPGAYIYQVFERLRDDSIGCQSSQLYVMILPGHDREQQVALTGAISDSLPPVLVGGIKPRDIIVSMSVPAEGVACGGVMNATNAGAFDGNSTNDATAYYVEQLGPGDGQEHLALRVEGPHLRAHWILLTVQRPLAKFNGDATVLRFDLTQPLLRELEATPENTVLCP